jgi:hypothetical protein
MSASFTPLNHICKTCRLISLAMLPPSPGALSYLRRSLASPLCSPTGLSCTPRTTPRPRPHPQSAIVLCHPPQCRALHLYKTARAKTLLGQHKILPFQIYKIPKPSESDHRVNLLTKPGGEKIAEGITLKELLEKHISPGNMLYLTEPVNKAVSENWKYMKETNLPQKLNNYAIVKEGQRKIHIAKHKHEDHPNPIFRDLAGLKEIHINLASPVTFFMLVLARAYAFLDSGHQIEFSIRLKGTYKTQEERRKPGDPEIWPWMHKHFPHLRPDFILKSMPKGAYYMIDPFSDGKHIQFVLAMPQKVPYKPITRANYTSRALMIKEMVEESIQAGRQPQLPIIARMKLIGEGSDMYSLDSGVAKAVVQEQFKETNYLPRNAKDIRWGTESLNRIPRAVRKATTKANKLEKKERKREGRGKNRTIKHIRPNPIFTIDIPRIPPIPPINPLPSYHEVSKKEIWKKGRR